MRAHRTKSPTDRVAGGVATIKPYRIYFDDCGVGIPSISNSPSDSITLNVTN